MAAPKIQECPASPDGKWTVLGICVFLAAITLAVFSQTLRCEFVNYDDDSYVYKNPAVTCGLTLKGIEWTFTHVVLSNWHPLTMMSHMLDCQLYGLKAGGHHLTNVLLHTGSVILLFLVLRQMTGLRPDKGVGATAPQAGAMWRSAFVAAVFAIHPLRVESVAWVAERKDVLSGLFFMLTLWAYVRYVEQSKVQSPKSRVFYGLALLFFALGLLSKPMVVTLPFVLLLLDYWPLNRFTPPTPAPAVTGNGDLLKNHSVPWRLILEKIPLLALTGAACVTTMVTQKDIIAPVPLALRIGNAVVSYVVYLRQMVCPAGLAVLYPYPRNGLPGWEITLAVVLLAAISTGVFLRRQKEPYLLTGWLWYLGMLVPAIGLVQSGWRAHADRYTYLPQIGLYFALTWAAGDLVISWRYGRRILGVGALSVIVALLVCTWKQTSYWRNSESLWTHTLGCTSDNSIAHMNLGVTLTLQGRLDEAIEHLQKALQINPGDAEAHDNLGGALFQKGNVDEAMAHYQKAIQLKPDYAEAHYNLANMLAQKDQFAEAIAHYQKAIQLNPDFAEAHYNLGVVFGMQGRLDEAVEQYRKAIQTIPDYADAHGNLANVLAAQGRLEEAIPEYRRTLELVPNSGQAHFRFGQALQAQRNFAAAIKEYQKVLDLVPRHLPVHLSLAWLLATSPEASLRNGQKAVELAQEAERLSKDGSPQILDTLAAAYAEAGQFGEAVETAKRALNLTATQNKQPLADAIQARLKLYEAGSPYHEKP
jgi:tetratricopeptide (TPR) repeat protein